jgi:hypothetical protein
MSEAIPATGAMAVGENNMFEGISKRMGEAGKRVAEADSETLWAEILTMAQNHDSALASHILTIGEMEHWTTTHTALALAYVHMVLSNGHGEDIKDLMAIMNRPIIMNRHCANCTCEDKNLEVDNG